jgi:hypothetical protein
MNQKKSQLKSDTQLSLRNSLLIRLGITKTDNDVKDRVELDIEHDKDEFIDSDYYRQIRDVTITDRGI